LKREEKTASYIDRRYRKRGERGRGKRKRKKQEKVSIIWMNDDKLVFIKQKSVSLGRAV